VHCYLEGQRLDAETRDLGPLGGFVRTVWTDQVGEDSLLSVSLRTSDDTLRDVFLFGRVRRLESAPTRGLALEWLRAVTTGPRVGLVTVLRDILGVPEAAIEAQRLAPDGKPCKVFHFESLTDPSDLSRRARPLTVPGVSQVRVPTAEHDWRRFPNRGPLTQALQVGEAREAVTLKAVLEAPGLRPHLVRVTEIGTMGLRLDMRGEFPPMGDKSVTVRFQVPLRRGVGEVACIGRVTASQIRRDESISVLDIATEVLDEGERPGVLERYVRWLKQRRLATETPT